MRAIILSALTPLAVTSYVVTPNPPYVPDAPQSIHQMCLLTKPAPGYTCDPKTGKIVKLGGSTRPTQNRCLNVKIAPGYVCDQNTGKVRPWGTTNKPDLPRIARQCQQITLMPGYTCDPNTGAIISTLPPERDPMRNFCAQNPVACRIVSTAERPDTAQDIRELNEDLAIERRQKAMEAQRQAEEQSRAAQERARQAQEEAQRAQNDARRAEAERERQAAADEQSRARDAARAAVQEDQAATALTRQNDQRTRERMQTYRTAPPPLIAAFGTEQPVQAPLPATDPILAPYKAYYPADGLPAGKTPPLIRTKAGEGHAPLSSTLMIAALAGRVHDLAVAVQTVDPTLTLRVTSAYQPPLTGPLSGAFALTARAEGRGVDLTLTRGDTVLRDARSLRLLTTLARNVGFHYAVMQDAEQVNGHVYASIHRPAQNAATYAQYTQPAR